MTWRKSSYSDNTACVELAEHDAVILVRNSNHPDAGTLTVPAADMAALIANVKAGRLDTHA